jgi:hypothetical protein
LITFNKNNKEHKIVLKKPKGQCLSFNYHVEQQMISHQTVMHNGFVDVEKLFVQIQDHINTIDQHFSMT